MYKYFEEYDQEVTNELTGNFSNIITSLGEDMSREGILKTPERAAKAMQFLMQGYDADHEQVLRSAMFSEDYNALVVVKDIELYSLCEPHMLPFFGKAHLGYIPDGYIVGLSKLPRVV